VAADHGIGFDVVDLSASERFPSLQDYKALVVLGGPASANDATEAMRSELAQVKQAISSGLPYLGICFGLQVGVKAMGGAVVPGKEKEIGFFESENRPYSVVLSEEGKHDPLFAGLGESFRVFQLHGETVELTSAMTLLAIGAVCHNQVVRIAPKAYGIQSHFELTSEMLAVWADQDPDLQPIGRDKLLADMGDVQAEYTQTGRALLQNFLKIANLIA